MKKSNRSLKILIESESLSPTDIYNIEEWENEGGMAASTSDFLKSLAPVKRGEIFEVKGGDIYYEDGKLYYEAEIKILALP